MELLIGAVIFLALLALLAIGVPVAFALGFLSILVLLVLEGGISGLSLVPPTVWSTAASFVLSSVPLFIFMGVVISVSGMGSRLYNAIAKWLTWLPGGLAVATTVASGIMAAVSGSSVATAAAIGSMAIKEMKDRGYSAQYATGSVSAGGTLGIIIPPSIPMIIYGITSGQSIGKLFMAGVIPGIILVVLFSAFQILMSIMNNKRSNELTARISLDSRSVSWKERFSALKDVVPLALLIVVILGSIYGGIATATEAAALGCLGSLILAGAYKTLNKSTLMKIILETAKSTSMIGMIIVGAMLFGYVLTVTNVASALSGMVANMNVSPWLILVAINLLLVFLGFFMETLSIIVITIPILAPVVAGMGWDLVWFGIIVTINMEMALITPPVGLNLYVVKGVAPDVPLKTIIKGAIPYVIIMAFTIALIALVPNLALWLPGLATVK